MTPVHVHLPNDIARLDGCGTWDRRHLSDLLTLEPVAANVFRGRFNESNASGAPFGGQLVAQAIAAADSTIEEDRRVHSLHGHFLRTGVLDQAIDYHVEHVRDGRRFSIRHVEGRQGGVVLCRMTCSYRTNLAGFAHQAPVQHPLDPDQALDVGTLARSGRADLPPFLKRYTMPQPIEIRVPGEPGFLSPDARPQRYYWLRIPSLAATDDPRIHRQGLAYLSDYLLPGASLVPHTMPLPGPHIFVASLDHALWFHHSVRCDDWLLFDTDSPFTGEGVALSRGLVFDREGRLVATIAQESLQIPRDLASE